MLPTMLINERKKLIKQYIGELIEHYKNDLKNLSYLRNRNIQKLIKIEKLKNMDIEKTTIIVIGLTDEEFTNLKLCLEFLDSLKDLTVKSENEYVYYGSLAHKLRQEM